MTHENQDKARTAGHADAVGPAPLIRQDLIDIGRERFQDAYCGDNHEDALIQAIEAALDAKQENDGSVLADLEAANIRLTSQRDQLAAALREIADVRGGDATEVAKRRRSIAERALYLAEIEKGNDK